MLQKEFELTYSLIRNDTKTQIKNLFTLKADLIINVNKLLKKNMFYIKLQN